MLSQVTEISNVKCVTRLPKETKRQAVAIIFTDDSARTFTCDSGEARRLQTSTHRPWASCGGGGQWGRAEQGRPGWWDGWGCPARMRQGPQAGFAGPAPPCLAWWDSSG